MPTESSSSGFPAPAVPAEPIGRIEVRLRPGGNRDELLGLRDGVLRARVVAPPVDGRANKSLCRLIAKQLGVPSSRVSVVRGKRSRDKLIAVHGFDATDLRHLLDR